MTDNTYQEPEHLSIMRDLNRSLAEGTPFRMDLDLPKDSLSLKTTVGIIRGNAKIAALFRLMADRIDAK